MLKKLIASNQQISRNFLRSEEEERLIDVFRLGVKVIFLEGQQSSGKSTILKNLQGRFPDTVFYSSGEISLIESIRMIPGGRFKNVETVADVVSVLHDLQKHSDEQIVLLLDEVDTVRGSDNNELVELAKNVPDNVSIVIMTWGNSYEDIYSPLLEVLKNREVN